MSKTKDQAPALANKHGIALSTKTDQRAADNMRMTIYIGNHLVRAIQGPSNGELRQIKVAMTETTISIAAPGARIPEGGIAVTIPLLNAPGGGLRKIQLTNVQEQFRLARKLKLIDGVAPVFERSTHNAYTIFTISGVEDLFEKEEPSVDQTKHNNARRRKNAAATAVPTSAAKEKYVPTLPPEEDGGREKMVEDAINIHMSSASAAGGDNFGIEPETVPGGTIEEAFVVSADAAEKLKGMEIERATTVDPKQSPPALYGQPKSLDDAEIVKTINEADEVGDTLNTLPPGVELNRHPEIRNHPEVQQEVLDQLEQEGAFVKPQSAGLGDPIGMMKDYVEQAHTKSFVTENLFIDRKPALEIPEGVVAEAYYEGTKLVGYMAHAVDHIPMSVVLSNKHMGINTNVEKARLAAIFLNNYIAACGREVAVSIEDGKVVLDKIVMVPTKQRL